MSPGICSVFLFLFQVIVNVKCEKKFANTYAVGFMHLGSRDQKIISQSKILVTSYEEAKFQIRKSGNYSYFWNLGPKHMWKVDFDPFKERMDKYDAVEEKGALISSDQDICIHGLNLDFNTYGGFRAEKLTPEATEFYLPAFSVKYGSSVYAIVAAENDTVVEIYYRDSKSGSYLDPKVVSMDIFDIYQNGKYSYDLTGTYIKSNKSVAVYSGVDCGEVPVGTNWCDNMLVGVPPVANLGNKFVMGPFLDRKNTTGYIFRVISTADNTSVEIFDDFDNDTDKNAYLSRGEFVEINYNRSVIAQVVCSLPCMVIQYNKGNKFDDVKTDPLMLLVPPVKEYANKLIWSIPEDRHGLPMYSFANIVAPKGKEDGVLLNENKVIKTWQPVPGGGYSILTVWVTQGPHTMRHKDEGVRIGAMIYGHGNYEAIAYGYPACDAGNHSNEEGNKSSKDLLYQMLCLLFGFLIGILLILAITGVIWRRRKLKGLAGFSFEKFDDKETGKDGISNQGHIVYKKDDDLPMTDTATTEQRY